MTDASGRPVLLDFGLAQEAARSAAEAPWTLSGAALATPPCTSPEQVRRRGRVDHHTDVFSLAVTPYDCLTLRRPFEANDPLRPDRPWCSTDQQRRHPFVQRSHAATRSSRPAVGS